MPRSEFPPSSALNRLNAYLDEMGTRGVADWEGLEPSLAATVDYVHGLDDRSMPAPGLMDETWRTLMGTAGIAQGRLDVVGSPAGAIGRWPTMHAPSSQPAARSRWFGGGLAAAILLIAVVVGYAAYSIAPSGDDERPAMPAAMQEAATAEASPGPALAGCTAEPRPDGSVVALAGTQPTVMRTLPRLNEDPVHFEQRSAPVDGDLFLYDDLPHPSDEAMAGINETLEELIACRFHIWDANGEQDLDGRYFALFSDDYFRGELAGYLEAALEPDILLSWTPRPGTSIVEAREQADGRVIVRLETEADRYMLGWRWVVIFAKKGDRWIVDEVGQATFADVPLTRPTIPSTPAGDDSASWLGNVPLELNIVLFDVEPVKDAATPEVPFEPTHQSNGDTPINFRSGPSTDTNILLTLPPAYPLRWTGEEEVDVDGESWMEFETVNGEVGWIRAVDAEPPSGDFGTGSLCDELSDVAVPCGRGYHRAGPYWNTDFPANTDLTMRLHNIGTKSHRFVQEELGLDFVVAPGESVEFVFNAPAGSYLILIYTSDRAEPSGAGVFTVVPEGQRPGKG